MKIFGLLAHPVSHSLSPQMYKTWFLEHGLKDSEFQLFDIIPEKLSGFLERVRSEKISGLAVSIPHKETVMQYLDEIDPVAEKIGAVNTISWNDKKLKGWNTDWIGVRETLKNAGVIPDGKRALVLGAGGSARAVIYALMQADANVVIANRTFEKAENLSSFFRCPLVHWDDRESVNAEIVINTTSVGLEDPSSSPVSADFWRGRETAFDLVYRPLMTRFLLDASHADVKIITGDQMLLHQGIRQFEILTS